MTTKLTWLIYNPVSGGNRQTAAVKYLQKFLPENFKLKIFKTEYAGHATELAQKAVDKNIDLLIAMGGDGTLHEVGVALIHSSLPMALFPMGSGNGLARHLRIPAKFDSVLNTIIKGKAQKIDVGQLDDHYFINLAGIGIDGKIAYEFNQSSMRGFLRYIITSIRCFAQFDSFSTNLSNQKHGNTMFISFLNGSQPGNNFTYDIDADLSDGQINYVIVPQKTLLYSLRTVILAFHGKMKNAKNCSFQKTSSVYFKTECQEAHIDGEPIKLDEKEHRVQVIPAALNLWI